MKQNSASSPPTNPEPSNDTPHEEIKDLGFGTRVSQSTGRLLNRDGSFNVRRKGLTTFHSLTLYHWLLEMSWAKFFFVLIGSYIAFNLLFAVAYLVSGDGALQGVNASTPLIRFGETFFFSVQTSTTVGYGVIHPVGIAANTLASIEAMTGLLGYAVATAFLFARFSKPYARIIFSRHAIVAPYRNITALEFRIANERRNQLIQVEVRVILSRFEKEGDGRLRQYHELSLERNQVMFFPLNWTVVHPIDEKSPMYGVTEEQFLASDAEMLILLTGIDETFSQAVHSRTSYTAREIVWGARFADMFEKEEGVLSVDLRRLHEIERIK